MLLQSIALRNFRNYTESTFSFSPRITYIHGPNAHGKTNLLEAIHFICTGKGIKDEKQEEMITFDAEEADIQAHFSADHIAADLRIHLSVHEKIIKTYFVDTAKKMLYTYMRSAPPVVLFTPERISIIDGSPAQRRSYIDDILCKIDIHYLKNLKNYESGLHRRNKILESEHDHTKLKERLQFWDEYLIKQAVYLVNKRQWICNIFNSQPPLNKHIFHTTYIPNEISEHRFHDYFIKETYQKRTLIGPQRDEFVITLQKDGKDIDTKKFASRGEQRLALIWLTLEQLGLYLRELKTSPLLLLDDIFSELDDDNKKIVTELVEKHQSVITTTETGRIKRGEIIAL